MKPYKIEYIWLDGSLPIQRIRSKTKIIHLPEDQDSVSIQNIPPWIFDGSITNQAASERKDCILIPAFICPDPHRIGGAIALCEVFHADGKPDTHNYRRVIHSLALDHLESKPTIAFEQEFVIMKDGEPIFWPKTQKARRDHYCGVGSENILGRDFLEDHLNACLAANLSVNSISATKSPSQWSYQIGGSTVDIVTASDHLIVSRYLLQRLGEKSDYQVSFEQGSLDGSNLKLEFSTELMREVGGIEWIKSAIDILFSQNLLSEINLTYSRDTDSEAGSATIPLPAALESRGYFEDHRPSGTANPYKILSLILKTVCVNETRLFSEKRKNQ